MTVQDRPLKGAWGMTALLFLFMLINFADKVVVGLAAQPIMKELNLDPKQFGLIGSSFFFLFAVSAVVVGFVSNRVQTRRTLFAMAIVWSLVQFPMLGTVSIEVLIASRIILGAGEGPAGPVATHAVYKWFPDSLRGLPTAIIAQGSALGVIIAVPATTKKPLSTSAAARCSARSSGPSSAEGKARPLERPRVRRLVRARRF